MAGRLSGADLRKVSEQRMPNLGFTYLPDHVVDDGY